MEVAPPEHPNLNVRERQNIEDDSPVPQEVFERKDAHLHTLSTESLSVLNSPSIQFEHWLNPLQLQSIPPPSDHTNGEFPFCFACKSLNFGFVVFAGNAALADRLRGKMILAPLTRGGSLPFRRLCVDFGADVTMSEMAFAKHLLKFGGPLFDHPRPQNQISSRLFVLSWQGRQGGEEPNVPSCKRTVLW